MEDTKVFNEPDTAKKNITRIILVILGATILGINLNSFVHFGNIIPGGFTGFSILIQKVVFTFFRVEIPYSFINIPLNLTLALVCFKYIGKKFAGLSLFSIILTSLLVDFLPYYELTYDPLLASVFGGLINGFAIAITLIGDATTGGTDFVSALYSKKFGVDIFNYIFLANMIMLGVAASIYGLEAALYSIIFQYSSTEVIHLLYKKYQKHTLFIITDKPKEVYKVIKEITNHGATLFKGKGLYKDKDRNLIYSIISSDELRLVIKNIKMVDEDAFIDVIHSDRVDGHFFQKTIT